MKFDARTYRRVTSALFAAALDGARWKSVLRQISRGEAMPCHLFGFDLEQGISTGWLSHGCDPEADQAFREHFHSLDPYPAAAAIKGKQRFAMLRDLIPDEKIKKTRFYNEWMKPQDRLLGGGGIVVSHSNTSMMILGTLIPERRIDSLEQDCERLLRAIVSPTRHAWAISRAVAGGALEQTLRAGAPDRAPAIMVLGKHGRIIFANGPAEDRLSAGDVARADGKGRLRFADTGATERLMAIMGALGHGPVGAEFHLSVPPQVSVQVSLSQIDPDVIGSWDLGLILGIQQPSVVVVMTEKASRIDAAGLLMSQHGLTRAEAEVASALAEGKTPSEVAEIRAVSLHTVRNQIKAAMSKCAVRRQVELAALVARAAR